MASIEVVRLTGAECRANIAALEGEVGKSADDLREARETWDMSVRERDVLDSIESYEWLLGDPDDVD